MSQLDNANPVIYQVSEDRTIAPENEDDDVIDKIDDREVFEKDESINHWLTIQQVNLHGRPGVRPHTEQLRKITLGSMTHFRAKGKTHINDPEHPLTLEELNVLETSRVKVNDDESSVSVEFTPTIPHCSMATLIGLSIRVKLLRSLPRRFKVDVHITPGTHASEEAVNKQLADKERVAAALENSHLLEVLNQCLSQKQT